MPDVTPAPGPLHVVKALASDVTLTSSSTTLQDVTGLGLAIGASATEVWFVNLWLDVNAANVTMDVKFGFTVPSGCTMRWGAVGRVAAGAASYGGEQVGNVVLGLTTESGTAPNATLAGTAGVAYGARVFGGGTAGTVQLQAAQNTSDAGALKILKGSHFEATRVTA
jgi:hypothetical protein